MNQLPVGGPTQPDGDKIHAVLNLHIFIIQPTAQIQLKLHKKHFEIFSIFRYLDTLDT